MLKNGSHFSGSSVPPSVRCLPAQREVALEPMLKVRNGWPFKVEAAGSRSRRPVSGALAERSSFVT